MNKIKYFLKQFIFLKALNSPFKPIIPRFYIGKIAIGTPYFYPRIWKENKDKPDFNIEFFRYVKKENLDFHEEFKMKLKEYDIKDLSLED